MAKTNKQSQRSIIILAVITITALVGLLTIDTDRVSADKPLHNESAAKTAGNNSENFQSEESFYTSALPSLARIVGALLIVIVCIYAGLYLLKRMTMKRYSGNGRHQVLEVLETTGVAPKKAVSLIRVADKSVLVGMTDNSITVLTELDAEQTARITAAYDNEKEADGFGQLLRTVSQRVKSAGVKKNRTVMET